MQPDHYAILGVNRNASLTEINDAYKNKKKLSGMHHPGRFSQISTPFKKENPPQEWLEIQDAYEVLSDELNRKAYNFIYDLKNKGSSERSNNSNNNNSTYNNHPTQPVQRTFLAYHRTRASSFSTSQVNNEAPSVPTYTSPKPY